MITQLEQDRLDACKEKLQELIVAQNETSTQSAVTCFYGLVAYCYSDIMMALTYYKLPPGQIEPLDSLLSFLINCCKPYIIENNIPRLLTLEEYIHYAIQGLNQQYGIKEYDRKFYGELEMACIEFARLISSTRSITVTDMIPSLAFVDKLSHIFDY